MRIAIISDIHSNLEALTRALQVIDAATVDEIYCLGDIVGYGGSPNECVDLVRLRAAKCVLGNHDEAALDPSKSFYFTEPGQLAAAWTNRVLTQENRDYLASLPLVLENEFCTLVHASPAFPGEWEYIASLDVAQEQFAYFTTPVCFIGHTHVPVVCGEDLRTYAFKKGMRFIVNVGSVGQPRDGNPDLSFGLLDTDTWEYSNVRSVYDVKKAAKTILKQKLPAVLANRLSQGV